MPCPAMPSSMDRRYCIYFSYCIYHLLGTKLYRIFDKATVTNKYCCFQDTNNDRITIEWTNTPDGAAKTFRREWFQGDGMVRRKNLPIEYNP